MIKEIKTLKNQKIKLKHCWSEIKKLNNIIKEVYNYTNLKGYFAIHPSLKL